MREPNWKREGTDPDYRFSLANERTFLAWLRTALAMLAGAVALTQFVEPFAVPGARTALGVLLAVLGTALAALSYRQWARNESAMRHQRNLPWTPLIPLLAIALGVIGVGIVVLSVLS